MSWHLAVATKHTNTTSDLERAGKHSLCKNTNRITTNKQMHVIFLTVSTFHQLLFHMDNHGHPYHTSTQTPTHTHTRIWGQTHNVQGLGVNLSSSRDHGVSGEGLCKMAKECCSQQRSVLIMPSSYHRIREVYPYMISTYSSSIH